jgi:nicotinate-nucleotide adenylyltransferase
MLYLATEDQPDLCVSTFEIARGGVHFTIDTLRALREQEPALAPVFVCGGDALADIASWRDYESLLAEFDFAAVIRPEDAGGARRTDWPEEVRRRVSPLPPVVPIAPGAGGRVFELDGPVPAVSSSLVRGRCTAGDAIDALVPARVARYIQRHRLYTEEAAR